MATGRSTTINLPHPVPLRVVYWTVALQPGGTVAFFRDLYGRDGLVLAGLDKRPGVPKVAGAARRVTASPAGGRVAPVALRQE